MNSYEHTLITRADVQEGQSQKIISKYKDIIDKNSGKVVKTEEWGLRTLAYQIQNNKKGFYFHIKFDGTGTTIEKLEKTANIDQMLIRFLTVRVKEHDLKKDYFEKKDT